MDKLQDSDLLFIASNLYPQISVDELSKMIEFISNLYHETMVACKVCTRRYTMAVVIY